MKDDIKKLRCSMYCYLIAAFCIGLSGLMLLANGNFFLGSVQGVCGATMLCLALISRNRYRKAQNERETGE